MKRKALFLALAGLSAAALLSGCGNIGARVAEFRSARSSGVETVSETEYAVKVITADRGRIIGHLDINGDVVAETQLDAFPETTGKLVGISVKVGDYVVKDQVVAEVDPSRPGMNFAVSPVKAPISGTVTAVTGSIGATVAPQVPILRIGRLSSLTIESAVAERFVSKVTPGMRAVVSLHAYPDSPYAAQVMETSPVIDPNTRTMAVKLSFVDADERVKAGMFSSVRLVTDVRDGVVRLPAQCVIERYGETFVFAVNGESRVEKLPVRLGLSIDGIVEITSGVMEGTRVVAVGLSLLENGALVKVVDELPPLPETNMAEGV